jgi:hypothetical protein
MVMQWSHREAEQNADLRTVQLESQDPQFVLLTPADDDSDTGGPQVTLYDIYIYR